MADVRSMSSDEPVLVRSGLRLDECVTETCLALKVPKRLASQTLELVKSTRACDAAYYAQHNLS